MIIFPATDIYEGSAVRLLHGDYKQMTVYGDPLAKAKEFYDSGALWLHTVDLQGAKNGGTPNFEVIETLVKNSGLFVQTGGGIRDEATVEKYLSIGVKRVILGTAAVGNMAFLKQTVKEHGKSVAVGVDIKNGRVAVKGWTEVSEYSAFEFCDILQSIGVKTVIVTDISKDGALNGTNTELYEKLCSRYDMNIIASGGVTSPKDIADLTQTGVYGAIIGKALYTGTYTLEDFLKEA